MYSKLIQMLVPLPSFFEVSFPADELTEEISTTICVDAFALRKGHNYATSVLNADTGRILAIVPHQNQDAITAVLQKVTGPIRAVVSDFALAMANAIQAVYPAAIHVLDRFHLVYSNYLNDTVKDI